MEDSVFTTDTILTRKEQIEFQKNGFYMKELFGVKELTQILLNFIWPVLIGIILGVGLILIFNIQQIYITFLIVLIIPIGFFLRNIFFYIFIGKLFCTNTGIYSIQTKKTFSVKMKYIEKAIKSQNKKYLGASGFDDLFTKIIVFIFISVFIGLLEYLLKLDALFLVTIFGIIIVTVSGVYGIIYGIRQYIEHFHPLYVFGNIGKKAQKLIIEIEDSSIQIQIENRENINYTAFDEGYRIASKNYSELLKCIEKMGQMKQKIGNGDLFNSERYFTSLRLDTVNTLIEIKKFIEMKKLQLIDIQSGMIRSAQTETEKGKEDTEKGIIKITENIEQFDSLIKGIL
ncbi:hypothetical protein HOO68_04135 [Candidatus Gracilibacteria bacterium]|nr:hypothetical protein [Candidatus Gracilibacteria bacterium]